jgi:hypothetical protein
VTQSHRPSAQERHHITPHEKKYNEILRPFARIAQCTQKLSGDTYPFSKEKREDYSTRRLAGAPKVKGDTYPFSKEKREDYSTTEQETGGEFTTEYHTYKNARPILT